MWWFGFCLPKPFVRRTCAFAYTEVHHTRLIGQFCTRVSVFYYILDWRRSAPARGRPFDVGCLFYGGSMIVTALTRIGPRDVINEPVFRPIRSVSPPSASIPPVWLSPPRPARSKGWAGRGLRARAFHGARLYVVVCHASLQPQRRYETFTIRYVAPFAPDRLLIYSLALGQIPAEELFSK